MRKILTLAFALLIFSVLTSYVEAATPTAAGVTAGTPTGYTAPTTPTESASIEGGQVGEVNLTVTTSTTRWAGFYGHVKGWILLADASDNQFLNWTISTISSNSNVYASNESTVDFTTLAAATVTDVPTWLNDTSASDNWQSTFSSSEARTFAGSSITAYYVATFNSSKV